MRKARLFVLLLAVAGASIAIAQPANTPPEPFEPGQLVTLDGMVTRVERPLATLESEGRSYLVFLGPAWFWEQRGYTLFVGDWVTVIGHISGQDERVIHLHRLVRGSDSYLFAKGHGASPWASRGHGHGLMAGGGGPHHPASCLCPHHDAEEDVVGCCCHAHAARCRQD